MKLKTCHISLLTAVLFTLLAPVSVYASNYNLSFGIESAENKVSNQDPESPSGTDNPEIRLTKHTAPVSQEAAATRDSEVKNSKPSVKAIERVQKEDEKVQKEEEDPLSFNFLYYIIEKFKVSDIVE